MATIRALAHTRGNMAAGVSGAVTVNATVPTHQEGDILVASLSSFGVSSPPSAQQSGWTVHPDTTWAVLYRVATDDEPATYSWSSPRSQFSHSAINVAIYAIVGANATDPLGSLIGSSGSGTTMNIGTLTDIEPGSLAIARWVSSSTPTHATPSGWTQDVHAAFSNPSERISYCSIEDIESATLAVSTTQSSSNSWAGIAVVVNAGAPPPPENFSITTVDHETVTATWDVPENNGGGDPQAGDFSLSWNTTTETDGPVTVTAEATNTSGDVIGDADRSFTIENTYTYDVRWDTDVEFGTATLLEDIGFPPQNIGSLPPGTLIYAQVRACNQFGCSEWSAADNTTTALLPAAEVEDALGSILSSDVRSIVRIASETSASLGSEFDKLIEVRSTIEPSLGFSSAFLIDADIPSTISTDLVYDSAFMVLADIPSAITDGLTGEFSSSLDSVRSALGGLRLDIGPVGQAPTATVAPIISASYRMSAGEISAWSTEIPAAQPNAELIEDGMEVRLIRDGEGELIRGIIHNVEYQITDSGLVLAVSGEGTERELVWHNTLLGREYASVPVSIAVDDLLDGTSWEAGDVADSGEVTGRFEGASGWQALRAVSESQGLILRANSIPRTVDVNTLGTERSLRFLGVDIVSPDYDRDTVPVQSLTLTKSSPDVWTRIIPIGGGEQVSALTLQHSTRNSPYTIQSDTGPDGQTYWYLQDDTAVALYGLRTQVVNFKDVSPLSNSFAELVRAANALYDLSTAWLEHHSSRQELWAIDVPSFRHRDPLTEQYRILPGDRALLRYRGIATAIDGRTRLWVDINEMAWCRGFQRQLTSAGDDQWTIEMASSMNVIDEDDVLAETVQNMWAIATSVKHSVIETQAGPFFDSIDNGHPVRLGVIYDSDIRYLHRAKLSVQRYAIRADATGAGGGGSTVTSTGSGGATVIASASGSAHTHTIQGRTVETEPSAGDPLDPIPVVEHIGHTNAFAGRFPPVPWANHPWEQTFVVWLKQGASGGPVIGEFGFQVARGSSSNPSGMMHTDGGPHKHLLQGFATQSESAHTHPVSLPNHNHSITLGDHTHPLVYGIHQGSLPQNPQFQVWINGTNRTSELGGPWNTNEFDLDITPYLVDAQGYVNQQRNTVEIRAANLQRVEVSVRSIVTIASTVPIG